MRPPPPPGTLAAMNPHSPCPAARRHAGAYFTYGYAPGEINGAAVSCYEWGVANDEWHPATSGYVASPGDVAVYGFSLGASPRP